MKSKGRLWGLSPLRSDGSWIVKRGGWITWMVANGTSKGGHQASVHSDQMVLMMARQVGWTGWPMAKDIQNKAKLKGNYQAQVYSNQMVVVVVRRSLRCSNESRKTTLYSQRTYSKTGSDSLRERFSSPNKKLYFMSHSLTESAHLYKFVVGAWESKNTKIT